MEKVDVDIYMNNFIRFFDNNPKDLKDLIGNEDKTVFYEKVRIQALRNLDRGEYVELTQKQILDICVDIHKSKSKALEVKIEQIFVNTKYGKIFLN